ncbi:MAG: MarR family transcriptional regulator [Candidatus Hydrogenedentes bacterium]|nr:MarR family transcriptional regulator [Candidatus Hydrogenedentota bacterium]
MTLQHELGLPHSLRVRAHEALLSLHYTAALLRKRATIFFRQHQVTDVQFNVLMLLRYQAKEGGGLSQVDLSRMMLVNRANITTLIDRMEKAGLVKRTPAPADRRSNIVRLTARGKGLVRRVEGAYIQEVSRIVGALDNDELSKLVGMLERVRWSLTGRARK